MSRRKSTNNKKVEKNDQIPVNGALNGKGWKNNPNYYFKDATQADVMSRIQMNAFGAVTPLAPESTNHEYKYVPSVAAIYLNPCPGVTNIIADGSIPTPDPATSSVKGINRAAQKLWYILTAKSGRAAGYTKSECAKLICAFGEVISTYEFIRRVFGISYAYSQRNRALPTMLWQAMHVDPDDFRKNAAVYLKRMNSLMAVMNQLPIMGNIAYFSKCQDIYQNIFMDAPSEMAQLWVLAPSTTWVLEENDGFVGGSYLRTVDMCQYHEDTAAVQIGVSTSATRNVLVTSTTRLLSDYIDIFEEQITNLLFSSAFSIVYSDILRAFDTGTLTRWSFDYIDEKYLVAPVYNEGMLWQIHNATICRGWNSQTKSDFDSAFDPTDYAASFNNGTPRNDVYEWANGDDVLVYNPVLNSNDHLMNGFNLNFNSNIIDFPNENPTVEERIEFTRFMISGLHDDIEQASIPNVVQTDGTSYITFNYELPDHWIELMQIYFVETDPNQYVAADVRFYNTTNASANKPGTLVSNVTTTKFHLFPLLVTSISGSLTSRWKDGIRGELNAWANMGSEWFRSINDMIYVDLFDIR